jgi:hypothetical protein
MIDAIKLPWIASYHHEGSMSAASKGSLSANFTGPRVPGVVLLARDLKVLGSQLIRVAKTVSKR